MPTTLLSLYPRTHDRFDELLAPDGEIRPHWLPLIGRLEEASPEDMRGWLDFVQSRIQENGVTYNVYADPKGTDRPWALDPLPLVIPPADWRYVEAAVTQRARLLDAMLADLYGPQRLLEAGLMPPALVFGHHGFLWPCRGLVPPGQRFLHFYAVDLARSPNGRWWVIADRTQAPSGAGYALENRLVVSRMFPEQFNEQRVQHLAGFFRNLQESLSRQAPVDAGEAPLIVLLTPGPYNETYFEHAYLARYLGFTLVEGQDLTVRGDTLFLKTLTGLQRVHVVLRRLDDDFCDPLELRAESTLGVAGLLQVVRAGRVLVANALGTGVLESPALGGFLPAIAESLLGETLMMPSVASWWCGEDPARAYVIEHLDELVVKPVYPTQRMEPVFGHELDRRARAELIARIEARPHAFMAQELVHLSQAPIVSRGVDRRLLARSIGLRVFAVAGPQGYHVMPGGLTRVAASASGPVISMQRGGSSKDTWVLSDTPVSTFSLLKHRLGAVDIRRAAPYLPSRSVENLFWLGRYTERCENAARLLRAIVNRLTDEAAGDDEGLAAALAVAERIALLPQAGAAGGGEVPARVLRGVHDPDWAGSLAAVGRRLGWAASHVRERLSADHWHALARLQEALRPPIGRARLDHATTMLDRVVLACTSLAGFVMDDMARDDGWRFLVIGRRIERLQHLSAIVAGFVRRCDGSVGGADCLLEIADGQETYRYRYHRPPELLPVIDLVVCDPDNPHSVAFQIAKIGQYLEALEHEALHAVMAPLSEPSAIVGGIRLSAFEIHVVPAGDCPSCTGLADQLERVRRCAEALSDEIACHAFAHLGADVVQSVGA
jgi:uncharacterized circularly permuted ATP-grasp superfamily protein/uncharacterized alpha-E superfamily protein